MMNTSVSTSAHAPRTKSSLPTCGPTTSVLCSLASGSTLLNTSRIFAPICSPFTFGSGGKRTRMSRELPKACTCAALTPALASAARSWSMFGDCAKFVSMFTPPVKSMPRFKPRTATRASEATMSTADSPYHTLRVRMNGKRVTLWKNSMDFRSSKGSDGQPLDLALTAVDELDQRPRTHERREHRSDDAEHQHHGEAAHRTRAKRPQHPAGDRRGDVGVENGGVRPIESRGDRGARRYAVAQLLADALVDQDVRIHRHAYREHHRRDAGQGERGAEDGQQRGEQDHIDEQHEIRDHAEQFVVDRHEQERRGHAEHHGAHPLGDVVRAETRPDGALLDGRERRRQAAGAQQQRELAPLDGIHTRDLEVVAEYAADCRAIDDFLGGAVDLDALRVLLARAVDEHHRHEMADVLLGVLQHLRRAARIEAH